MPTCTFTGCADAFLMGIFIGVFGVFAGIFLFFRNDNERKIKAD